MTAVAAVLLYILWLLASIHCSCSWRDFYGTKTAYRNHAYRPSEETLRRAALSVLRTSECRPVHISALYRHGTRNPSRHEIKTAIAVHLKFMGEPSIENFLPEGFRTWKPLFKPGNRSQEFALLDEGRSEHRRLGFRMRARMSAEMTSEKPLFDSNNTEWFTSSSPRSRESGEHFALGLMGDVLGDRQEKAASIFKTDDEHLRFFDRCTAYHEEVKDNPMALQQSRHFHEGPEMNSVLQRVRERLHLPSNMSLSVAELDAMFAMCASEVAANRVSTDGDHQLSSPWCALFSEEDRRVMEYSVDLNSYWTKSYGYPVNYVMSCSLLNRMRNSMEEATNRGRRIGHPLTASFSFAHAETLLPIVTLLGLFNDPEPLLATNYGSLGENPEKREFRTSALSPFAANLVLVLHRCSSGRDDSADTFRVQPLLNELPVVWARFGGRTDVEWEVFLRELDTCWPPKFEFGRYCRLVESV